jgi:hypothetical protein
MAKKLETKVTNKIAEQLVLNTMNKLKGPDILKKLQEKAKTGDKASEEPKVEAITDADMTNNARAAAHRGAILLDKRVPGWSKAAPTVESDTDPATRKPDFLTQLGILKKVDTDDKGLDALNKFMALQDGEERFVSSWPADFTDEQRSVAAFLAMITGEPVARQERSKPAVKGTVGEIDYAYYGFGTEFNVIGLGQRGGYKATEAELDRKGFCIEKAGRALAAAWNDEVALRKGKK